MYQPFPMDLEATTASSVSIDTDSLLICITPADAIGPDDAAIEAALYEAELHYEIAASGWSKPDDEDCVVARLVKATAAPIELQDGRWAV